MSLHASLANGVRRKLENNQQPMMKQADTPCEVLAFPSDIALRIRLCIYRSPSLATNMEGNTY